MTPTKRAIVYAITVSLVLAITLGIYWLFGGDFHRGTDLGFTAIIDFFVTVMALGIVENACGRD